MKFIRCGARRVFLLFYFIYMRSLHRRRTLRYHISASHLGNVPFRLRSGCTTVVHVMSLGRPYYRLPNLNICTRETNDDYYSPENFAVLEIPFHSAWRRVTTRRPLYFHLTFFAAAARSFRVQERMLCAAERSPHTEWTVNRTNTFGSRLLLYGGKCLAIIRSSLSHSNFYSTSAQRSQIYIFA